MNAIGWNPFNTNENAVLGSNKVSFYNGHAGVSDKRRPFRYILCDSAQTKC